jgi:hypothetical protein
MTRTPRTQTRPRQLFAQIAEHARAITIAKRELRTKFGFTDAQISAGASAALRANPEIAALLAQKGVAARTPKGPAAPRSIFDLKKRGSIF